jgi:hypothetical protein
MPGVRDVNRTRGRPFVQDLAAQGGRAGSSEYEGYGFNNQQRFTSAVTQLAQANLMVRETDPDDGTRTVKAVTALGWLVHFYRADFELPGARTEQP